MLLASSPSVLSRAVTRLENRIGAQLLRRTTRRVSLTDTGRLYLDQTRAAFALLGDAERGARGAANTLSGRIRLSVPTTWGHFKAPSLITRFSHMHPGVSVEMNITNRNVDLITEGFDLAVRLGEFTASGLVARKLADEALCLVASPEYLERMGTPSLLESLRDHCCLPFKLPSTGRLTPWVFRDKGADIEWVAPSPITVSDDVLGVVSLAVAGAGIAQTYDFIACSPIAKGELVELLPQLRGRSRPFSVVYAPHRRQAPATRAMIAMLTGA